MASMIAVWRRSLTFLLLLLLTSTIWGCSSDEQRTTTMTAGCQAEGSNPTLEYAFETHDALCRIHRVAAALEALGPERAEVAGEFLQSNLPFVDDASLALTLRWWAEIAPAQAFERARKLPRPRRPVALGAVLERWAETDPIAAARALTSIPIKRRTKNDSLAVATGWDASGEPGLEVFIASIESTQARNLILGELLTRLTNRDGLDAMLEWVESRPETLPNGFQLASYRRAASILARHDIDRARRWVEGVEIPAYRPALVRAVALHWVLEDPSAGMGWVSKEPPSPERDQTIHEAFRVLSHRDETEAATWFDAQPYEEWLEPALAFRLGALAHSDGAAAILQIDRIKDAKRRQATTSAIYNQWHLQDQNAAESWLARADLPPEDRQQLERKGLQSRKRSTPHHDG